MKDIAIIGGGIGGLFAGTLLALRGHKVTIFEKNQTAGGKLWAYSEADYHFDYGPSTLTMPWLFQTLAREVGLDPDHLLPYQRLPILHRNVFADGVTVDAVSDTDEMAERIASLHSRDGQRWHAFLDDAKRLYELATTHFFTRTFTRPSDYLSWPLLRALLATRPYQSLHTYHERYFHDPRVLMMLDRYATYVGSSPYQTPATLGLIAHVEYGTGSYYLPGGTTQLINALIQLAQKAGAKLQTEAHVTRILTHSGRIKGVQVHGEKLSFDHVLVAADHTYALSTLLGPEDHRDRRFYRLQRAQKSHSGFALLLGVAKIFPQLAHHTVFYPAHYASEFEQLFASGQLLSDPTVYICHTGNTDQTRAPEGGSNLFVLVNTPSTATDLAPETWARYEQYILTLLEDRCGLTGLRAALRVVQRVTPHALAVRTHTPDGAIYGLSSNSMRQALMRPPMTLRGLHGVTFTGGSTHPGGGTPMVAISARLAADLITASQ